MTGISRRSTLAMGLALAAGGEALAQDAGPKDGWFTTTDGLKLHYLEQDGGGTPVILLHGFRSRAQNWFRAGTAPLIASHKHRVIALDGRGHGESDKPTDPARYAGDRMYQDAIELMDHLKLGKAHIGGYSMGSIYVARLMDMAPERFITAFLGGGGFGETDPVLAAQAKAKDTPMAEIGPRLDALVLELQKDPAGAPYIAVDKALRPWLTTPFPIDLTKIDFPVLSINGENDRPHVKTQRMARELKTHVNVIVPGKDHNAAPMDALYRESLAAFIDKYDRA